MAGCGTAWQSCACSRWRLLSHGCSRSPDMNSISNEISVRFQYTVHFTDDLFAPANTLLRDVVSSTGRPGKLIFVVDAGASSTRDLPARIQQYCHRHREALRLIAPPLVVPGGEEVKNTPHYVHALHEHIHRYALCRHSF